MKQNLDLYDTSDYPKDHFCYSVDNKKVIGKFKDETNAQPIKEFVGLRAKMYSILKYDDASKAVAKGVKRSEIKNLTHENYKRAIFGSSKEDLQQKVNFNIIGHTNHILYTMNVNKTGLCAYDDKKYVLEDNINTLAHGHYKILGDTPHGKPVKNII
jgi:hypothetical protein